MPIRSDKDIQPEHLKMNLEQLSRSIQEILAKNKEDIDARLDAFLQQSQAQTEELKTRLENIERTQHGDMAHHCNHNRNHERN